MAMITPASFNLTIVKGADFSFSFDIDINGAALNLTGATVKSEIRKDRKKTSSLIETFTVTVTVGSVSGYNSNITLSLTDTETSCITASEGSYDVLVTDPGGIDTYYLRGDVTFLDSVTEKS